MLNPEMKAALSVNKFDLAQQFNTSICGCAPVGTGHLFECTEITAPLLNYLKPIAFHVFGSCMQFMAQCFPRCLPNIHDPSFVFLSMIDM